MTAVAADLRGRDAARSLMWGDAALSSDLREGLSLPPALSRQEGACDGRGCVGGEFNRVSSSASKAITPCAYLSARGGDAALSRPPALSGGDAALSLPLASLREGDAVLSLPELSRRERETLKCVRALRGALALAERDVVAREVSSSPPVWIPGRTTVGSRAY